MPKLTNERISSYARAKRLICRATAGGDGGGFGLTKFFGGGLGNFLLILKYP
ncbi:hypothetical protein PT377_26110 [Klebsiella variicola]|uniref:hypothetical protein n=1 Tax=Klebsiella variicola TaxID=244366 RepID=UPI0023F91B29|nr:hypothetical protein [Klebsiella variicola]MDF7646822.1 hypothetical protein [Klebsiella variicola]